MSDDSTKMPAPDPFNPESLRLSQDFSAQTGVDKLIARVPVRKPGKQEFVRVHTATKYSIDTMFLELKSENETYLFAPGIHAELFSGTVPVRLFTTMTRQDVILLWPCKLPRSDDRTNPWHQTALEAAAMAQDRWVKVVANMHLGGYETFAAKGDLPEPEWPDLSLQELIRIAFKDRLIDSVDHPVVGQFLGRC